MTLDRAYNYQVTMLVSWGFDPSQPRGVIFNITKYVNKLHQNNNGTHVPLECPFTTELFLENGYDFTTCNNVRNILCNTDVIIG